MAAILLVVALPTSAQAAEPTFTPVERHDVVRRLVFPVVGISQYWSGFGGWWPIAPALGYCLLWDVSTSSVNLSVMILHHGNLLE